LLVPLIPLPGFIAWLLLIERPGRRTASCHLVEADGAASAVIAGDGTKVDVHN
jgi:hypothetical protein